MFILGFGHNKHPEIILENIEISNGDFNDDKNVETEYLNEISNQNNNNYS